MVWSIASIYIDTGKEQHGNMPTMFISRIDHDGNELIYFVLTSRSMNFISEDEGTNF